MEVDYATWTSFKTGIRANALSCVYADLSPSFLWDRDFTKEWLYKHIIRLSTILDNHYHFALTVLKPNPSEADVKARFDAFQSTRSSPRRWYPRLYNEWSRRLTDFSAFMQEINRSSACYLNALDDKKGHVWGARFGSVPIEDGAKPRYSGQAINRRFF